MPLRLSVFFSAALGAVMVFTPVVGQSSRETIVREPAASVLLSLQMNGPGNDVYMSAPTGQNGIATFAIQRAGGYTLAFAEEIPYGSSLLFTNGAYTLRVPLSRCAPAWNGAQGQGEGQILSFNALAGDTIMVRVEKQPDHQVSMLSLE